LRKVVAREFIPRVAQAMRPRIDVLATNIIDQVAAAGACDLVPDVAGLMPSYVIADMLGIPHEDGVALYELTEAIHAAPESQAAGAAMQAILEMFNYANGVWQARRAEPSDDLADIIAHATVDGRELDVIDFNLFFLLLIDAGGDTTRNLVAGGMDALFAHPEQMAWLMADLDARLAPAVEELLRWVSPVVYMRRTAQQDTELRGVPIRAGQKVVMYYGSANRDPEVFGPSAGELDLSRAPNDHIAFGGGGPHFCLGTALARQEMTVLFRELLTRLPAIRSTAEPGIVPSNFDNRVARLPFAF
jgi:cytochrome P450